MDYETALFVSMGFNLVGVVGIAWTVVKWADASQEVIALGDELKVAHEDLKAMKSSRDGFARRAAELGPDAERGRKNRESLDRANAVRLAHRANGARVRAA